MSRRSSALSMDISAWMASVVSSSSSSDVFFFFFFQAEDGIRDLYVTGVQTCALPISEPLGRDVLEVHRAHVGRSKPHRAITRPARQAGRVPGDKERGDALRPERGIDRSEERRVGKECRS